MDYQVLFNIVVGILGALGGWILNAIWNGLKELQNADKDLAEKVGAIEVLVAGQYMTRDEFTTAVTSINAKLDRIQETLNRKVDK